MGVSKVMATALDYIGIDFILLDPAVPEILYFKHDLGASLIIIFIGNPHVDNLGDATLALWQGNIANRISCIGLLTYV